MNILFFIHRYPNYGGTEKVTTVICNELAKRGHNVYIASLFQKSWELMEELDDKINFYSLSYPVISRTNITKIRNIIKEQKIDIIVNQWCLPIKTSLLLRIASRGLNVKLVSVLHGAPDVNMRLISTKRKISTANLLAKVYLYPVLWATFLATAFSLWSGYHLSNKYLLLSSRFIPIFKRMACIYKGKKLSYITNPLTIKVDSSQFSKNAKELLYVGRMDLLNKNVDRILNIWSELHESYKDWTLVLVGDGPDRQYLEDMALKLKLTNVRFIGFIKEEPIQFYKDASIFLLTSDLEGFGLVITEAMYYGCVPVVYGSYPAVYDIIEDGISGYITPYPYDHQYSTAVVRRLIEDADLRSRLSMNAKIRVDKFKVEYIVDHWEEMFVNL